MIEIKLKFQKWFWLHEMGLLESSKILWTAMNLKPIDVIRMIK